MAHVRAQEIQALVHPGVLVDVLDDMAEKPREQGFKAFEAGRPAWDTAMQQARCSFQAVAGAEAKASRMTFRRAGMKASSMTSFSAHSCAMRSRFSSPIVTMSSSISSSSSSALEVQSSMLSST